MKRRVLALAWSPGEVSLREFNPSGEAERWKGAVPSAIGTHRYDLALSIGPSLTLRVPGGSRAPFFRSVDRGRTFQRVEPVPGSGPLSPGRCRAHGNGTLTVIEDGKLWIRPPMSEIWLRHDIPAPLRIHDLSIDEQGILLAAGEIPLERSSDKGPQTEAALARLGSEQALTVQLPLADSDRKMLVKYGGAEAFRRIDVESAPYLLTSSCAWMFEDPSDFLFTGWRGPWQVRRMERQFIRSWSREGAGNLTVFSVQGRRYRTRDQGATWEDSDLMESVRAAWKTKRTDSFTVAAAAVADTELALAVSRHDWDAPDGQALLGSAILTSTDDGKTFIKRSEAFGPDREFLALLLEEG